MQQAGQICNWFLLAFADASGAETASTEPAGDEEHMEEQEDKPEGATGELRRAKVEPKLTCLTLFPGMRSRWLMKEMRRMRRMRKRRMVKKLRRISTLPSSSTKQGL